MESRLGISGLLESGLLESRLGVSRLLESGLRISRLLESGLLDTRLRITGLRVTRLLEVIPMAVISVVFRDGDSDSFLGAKGSPNGFYMFVNMTVSLVAAVIA